MNCVELKYFSGLFEVEVCDLERMACLRSVTLKIVNRFLGYMLESRAVLQSVAAI